MAENDASIAYERRLGCFAMDKATIRVGDKDVVLTAGLAATGEIKTGTRRIIEYFLSPIVEYADEAIRER